MTEHPEVGSICSGGRYDDLASYFTDKKLPGVGISIGLSRLFYIINEQNMLNNSVLTSPCDVLVIPMTESLSPAISLATSMREAGLRVQIYFDDKKFKSKISYANKLGVPYVVFLGEDELERGVITVKDMNTGDQTTATAGILTAGLVERLNTLHGTAPIG
jgi:histidyl-tRNA synthetase